MTLLALIKKNGLRQLAAQTMITPETVAKVATVTVAESLELESAKLFVTVYTPKGKAMSVQARDAEHAEWLQRMNPNPTPELSATVEGAMTLSTVLPKNEIGKVATLTVATPATVIRLEDDSVAPVASVAVAYPESDHGRLMDDRRHCLACANLSAGRCLSAWRGEIVASRQYRPIDNLPRRCEGYAPKSNDPDQRTGKQRWPGLNQPKG